MASVTSFVLSSLLLPFAVASTEVNAMVPGVSIFSVATTDAESDAMVPGVTIFSVASPGVGAESMVPGVTIFSVAGPGADVDAMVPGVTIFSIAGHDARIASMVPGLAGSSEKLANVDGGFRIDDSLLVASSIPEPASAMLWIGGLLYFGWAARRQSSNRRAKGTAAMA